MPEPTNHPTQITFSRGTWIALVAFALIMFAGITIQLLLIEDQRSTNDRQLRTIVRQANSSLPLIRETRPLVQQARGALPAVERLGRRTTTFLDAATPLAEELSDARAPEQLQAAGALARSLLEARTPENVQAAGALARSLLEADLAETTRALQRANLPQLADDLRAVSGELLRQRRLRRLLVRSNAVLGEVRARNLVKKSSRAAEAVPRMETILTESLAVQREILMLTEQTRDIADRTRLEAQRAAAAAQSIDRKTGPSAAPPSPAPAPERVPPTP